MATLPIKDLKSNIGLEGFDVTGIIKKIFPHRAATGQYGDYTEQDIIITDGEGENDEIKLRLRDHPAVTEDHMGMEILCKSKENKKQKKMMGVKVKKDTWDDKRTGEARTEVRIIVSGSAEVKIGEGIVEDLPLDDDGNPLPPKPKATKATKIKENNSAQVYEDATMVIKDFLLRPSVKDAFMKMAEAGYTEETIRSFISGRVIEANRQASK